MGCKGIGDARSVHDSAANKAREARKLRVRVKKHANAMLMAIEKQEHDIDTNRFKAKVVGSVYLYVCVLCSIWCGGVCSYT